MTDHLTDAALAHLNAGKSPASGRAEDRLVTADQILAKSVTDHYNAAGEKVHELRVTLKSTGTVVYLPAPATPTAALIEQATDDDLESMSLKDLKALAASLGVPTAGGKPQLIDRIYAYQTVPAGTVAARTRG